MVGVNNIVNFQPTQQYVADAWTKQHKVYHTCSIKAHFSRPISFQQVCPENEG